MNAEAVHGGGCLCGAVRYRIAGPVEPGAHCHCAMCRRASGGIVVTWITVPTERFSFTRGQAAVYKSSAEAERRFCATCGAQLTFWSSRHPDHIDVTVATLDRPEDHPPDRHIWTASRIAWLHLDEDLPRHPEFTPRGD